MKYVFTLATAIFLCSNLLFAQVTVPALSSSISGTIWQEAKPNDGVISSVEKIIPGVLVKLLDANTGLVVATALSNENGEFTLHANGGNYVIEYVYPSDGFTVTTTRAGTDNSFNSAANSNRYSDAFTIADGVSDNTYGLGLIPKANTITKCTAKGNTVTNWDENLLLPKPDVSITPISVKLVAVESVWHPAIEIENMGSANAYDIYVSGQLGMTLPNTNLLTTNTAIPKSGTLPAYDGSTDYSGPSAASWTNLYTSATSTYDYPAFKIADFSGSGSVSIPTTAKGFVGISGGGNLQTLVETYVSAGVCAVYTFADGALPVNLVSFTSKAEGQTASLAWSTTAETNSERFDVQRSLDGKDWKVIGSVSASGESKTTAFYSFSDNSPLNGQNFYRLKMIDLDNTFAYSRINNVLFENKSLVNVYPNPVINELFTSPVAESKIYKVQIYNTIGQIVKESYNTNSTDVSQIRSGLYNVKVTLADGSSDNRKIMIK